MHSPAVLRILGVLLIMFSGSQVPPLAVSLLFADGAHLAFAAAFAVTLGAGLACWLPVRRCKHELRYRDGFLVVVMFWTVLAAFGAVPLLLAGRPAMGLTDALFESMSGLTTTGATVLSGIDDLPHSIRYYRQQLQWLGGMGIIVLAVAVMPMLGIGGMQLYRAETPGPVKDSKLTPRIKESAKTLWYLYLGLTVLCAAGYFAAGMDWFDAIAHSFSTVAIGGFSTHDASLGHFQSPAVAAVAMVFMVLAGINFALHFTAVRTRNAGCYLRDSEVRGYLLVLAIATVVTITTLAVARTMDGFSGALLHGMFQVISIGTTTGFTTVAFSLWPSFLPLMLILMGIIGGCAGSTAGGMKVIRVILLFKQGRREMRRLIHPNALMPIKLGAKPIGESILAAVWGFAALYMFSFVLLLLLLSAAGNDLTTALSTVAACLNNLGPALGAAARNYAALSDPSKWLLSFAMLLGRLELFTLLVIFSRSFWRS
ncbi:MAG: TrkH family potassium uptake protein [Gammaproteobacteria bacterium]|nr:TrkH family potassium uptake protein [Gammaproteobacteria bacterium]